MYGHLLNYLIMIASNHDVIITQFISLDTFKFEGKTERSIIFEQLNVKLMAGGDVLKFPYINQPVQPGVIPEDIPACFERELVNGGKVTCPDPELVKKPTRYFSYFFLALSILNLSLLIYFIFCPASLVISLTKYP